MIDKLKEIFVNVLEVDEGEITEQFSPDDALYWDSMNNLRLITAIEEEFKIHLSMGEIETMVNFGAIAEIVKTHTRKESALHR